MCASSVEDRISPVYARLSNCRLFLPIADDIDITNATRVIIAMIATEIVINISNHSDNCADINNKCNNERYQQ